MPAGQSITGIANIALIELGESPITDISENRTPAILCRTRYDDVRQGVIREHPWNCTKKYVVLATQVTAPPFKWQSAFLLPPDYIRMNRIDDDLDAEWEVAACDAGNVLYTDQGAPLNLIYHFDLQDPTRFDPKMAQCIGYTLALEIGPRIVRDAAAMNRIAAKLKDKIEGAKSIDAQENSPEEWDDDVLLRSRR
ncbi:MAG TPA: hypothetical protein VGG48_01890 [Rhizomicrobium sp.]|jgi:hypothetical protein